MDSVLPYDKIKVCYKKDYSLITASGYAGIWNVPSGLVTNEISGTTNEYGNTGFTMNRLVASST